MKLQIKNLAYRQAGYKLKITNGGFSLIEVLVSMAIFSLIIGGVVLFSVRTIEAHTKAQAMQNAIDNARFVTESANKKIRTSHNISDGALNDFSRSDEIFIIDNVGAVKYCYMFDGANNALTVAKIAPTEGSYGAANDCSAAGFTGNFSNVVGGGVGIGSKISVTGGFFVKNTDEAINDRGFVRTVIVIEYNDTALSPSERDKVLIQSSVSIRDY